MDDLKTDSLVALLHFGCRSFFILRFLLSGAAAQASRGRQEGPSQAITGLKLGARKMRFMQSWVLAQQPSVFDRVVGELRLRS